MPEDSERNAADETVNQIGFELAEELREIARALLEHEIDAKAAGEALRLAREIRTHLAGERRPRWYEAATPNIVDSQSSRSFDVSSPIRGRLNPVAPPLQIEVAEREDGTRFILGRARLSNVYEGPPRGVHGGIVAALFDEILGASMSLAPPPGVTATLEVSYHHLTPLDEDLRFESWIVEERERRVFAEATCHAGDTLTARAKALFIRVDFKEVEDRMRTRADS
jgi:acyl-coenzyme A thioesterase PaaI-like protein